MKRQIAQIGLPIFCRHLQPASGLILSCALLLGVAGCGSEPDGPLELQPLPGYQVRVTPEELDYKFARLEPSASDAELANDTQEAQAHLLSSQRQGFEQITSQGQGPLFDDVTASVFGATEAFKQQLAFGQSHWGARIDASQGADILGHHGLAVADVDGDGRDDVYLTQTGGLPNRLFLQQADGTVQDHSAAAGVDYLDLSSSALLVDLDNDGDADLAVALGQLVLHSNDGSGQFSVETVVSTSKITSMAAADYDNDGDLDLYICRSSSAEDNVPLPIDDAENGEQNALLRNDGAFQFTDVTSEVGLDQNNRRFSLAAAWEDIDNDGDQDLYVANDFGDNNLYRNDGGRFVDIAAEQGMEEVSSGMSVDWGDFDRDGQMDLNVGQEAHATMGRWSGSSKFADLDNNGWQDVVIANGYLSNPIADDLESFFWRQVVSHSPPEASSAAESKEYLDGWRATYELLRQGLSWGGNKRNVCLLNTGDGKFSDVSTLSGFDLPEDARGLAIVDWDRDGAVDVLLSNRTGPQVRAFRNTTKSGDSTSHFLALRLRGETVNRDAIGARVEVKVAGEPQRQIKTLRAGDGFLSQSSQWLHFGLGDAEILEDVTVRWPGGDAESFVGLQVDQRYELRQGSGQGTLSQTPSVPALQPKEVDLPQPSQRSRVLVAPRLPVYGLKYLDATVSTSEVPTEFLKIETGEQPLLLNVWASWCGNCRAELEEFSAARSKIQDGNLQILALSADTAEAQAAAQDFLNELDWPFARGLAAVPLLEVLSALRQAVLDQPTGWVVPMSFLIDAQGRLAAIYQGPVTVAQLLDDVEHLTGAPSADRERAKLFPGRWFGEPPQRSVENLANVLSSRGFHSMASRYLEMTEIDAPAPQWAQRHKAESLLELGRVLEADGNSQEAIDSLQNGLQLAPELAPLHLAIAQSYETLENLEQTTHHLQEAIRLEPNSALAFYRLGLVQLRVSGSEEGVRFLKRALQLSKPGDEVHYLSLFNLGVYFGEQQEDPEKAEDYVRRSLDEEDEHPEAIRYLGLLLQRREAYGEAAELFRRALVLEPDHGRTIYYLGFCYYHLGDRDGLEAQFQRLTDLEKPTARRLERLLEEMGEPQ